MPNIQPTTWKRLQQAQELVTAEQYAEGIELLEAMVPRDGRRSRYNAAELGQVHNLLGYAYWKLERADKTIEHYEKVLEQVPEIPEAIELLMLFQLSKIYFMQAQEQKQEELASRWYASSLAKMGEWLDKNDDPGAEPFYFIAQVYYQLKDFESGIKCLETTISVARAAGSQVKEPWWRMLQFMYYEQENWPKVEEILEILVKDYPKREYWVTLASVYAETGQEEKQLLALEAAHAGGYLDKETDLRANDIPEAIEDLEAAGKLEPEGKTFDLLTSLYLDSDQYSECRGGPKGTGTRRVGEPPAYQGESRFLRVLPGQSDDGTKGVLRGAPGSAPATGKAHGVDGRRLDQVHRQRSNASR